MNQCAFVKNRSISDHVLLAQEFVSGYGSKGLSPKCSIKVDLRKAFDSIDWNFLFQVLKLSYEHFRSVSLLDQRMCDNSKILIGS